MRIWSLSPAYLDPKGLVALWRESLLALAVLAGRTRGYRNHPQLKRFLGTRNPVNAMRCYLWHIYLESKARGYHFDGGKIGKRGHCDTISVTSGQLRYEMKHLRRKLSLRNEDAYRKLSKVRVPEPHPLFVRVAGKIEEWEKTK